MPATTPPTTELAAQQLQALGALIRAEREASVAVGACANVLATLGLKLTAIAANAARTTAHSPPPGNGFRCTSA